MPGISQPAFIQTITGRLINLAHVKPEDIDPIDFAHSTSMLARWNGNITRWYSVGDHSLYVARLMEKYLDDHPEAVAAAAAAYAQLLDNGVTRSALMAFYSDFLADERIARARTPSYLLTRTLLLIEALIHDSAEGYVGDLASPFKHQLPDFCETEANIEACIREALQLPTPCIPPWIADLVKAADTAALFIEARELCARPDVLAASSNATSERAEQMHGYNLPLEFSTPTETKLTFIGRLNALTRARNELEERLHAAIRRQAAVQEAVG